MGKKKSSTELIPAATMEAIASIEVTLDAGNIESYVATKFRDYYADAINEALKQQSVNQRESDEVQAEAEQLVTEDAETRLKVKIATMAAAFTKWGLQIIAKVTTVICCETTKPRGKTEEVTEYKTYRAKVFVEFPGDLDEENRYHHSNNESFELHVDLKYPAKAAKLLQRRDCTADAAERAKKAALELKRAESNAITQARDKVGAMIVENRLRAVEGGEALVAQLDNLTAQLVTNVDKELQLKLEAK